MYSSKAQTISWVSDQSAESMENVKNIFQAMIQVIATEKEVVLPFGRFFQKVYPGRVARVGVNPFTKKEMFLAARKNRIAIDFQLPNDELLLNSDTMNLTQAKIISLIAKETNLTTDAVRSVFQALSPLIVKADKVSTPFGYFFKRVYAERPERVGVNSLTGKKIVFSARPAVTCVKFKPCKALKEKLQG